MFRRPVEHTAFDTYLDQYDDVQGIRSSETLMGIAMIGFLVQMVEARWCPFRPEVFDYPQYQDYIRVDHETMKRVQYHLQQHDTIKCFMCNQVLNDVIVGDSPSDVDVKESPIYRLALILGIRQEMIC